MNELEEYLAGYIQSHGSVDIGQFMIIALSHPVHGYYMKQDPFGRGGDFTTAPEISQMFGEMIGVWVADVWEKMGKPAQFTLLECGPGRGTLMADLLRVAPFKNNCEVHLLEMSPVLKALQAKAVPDAQWHESLDTIPCNRPVIIIANEFLDALPVRQFQKIEKGWMERVVNFNGREFEFKWEKSSSPLVPQQSGGRFNDVFEISPSRNTFTKSLSHLIKQTKGAALLIDYGHVQPGYGDTLQAVKEHRYVPVLRHIGDADLTAHVDFHAIAEEAKSAGVAVSGPVEQGVFLKSLGIEMRAEYLKTKAKNADDIESALHRLVASDQMGSLFKVMGLSYDTLLQPAGF